MSYKIIGKYIKKLDFNIPNPKTFFLLSKDISNYKINIDIKSAQVKENIGISQSDAMPIVITRRNRQETGDSLCVLKLDDFLELYKLLIKEKGMSD